ncbi:MAG: GNAT family N-acetyltransferase [Nitrospirota bacterium]
MEIRLAKSDEEIAACLPVMRELRPHVTERDFVSRVRRQAPSGYSLAYILEGIEPVAVAGYRIGENLAWGRFLYVDDLVTRSSHRSRGYGAALLSWLMTQAAEAGCEQVHLDSGIHRTDAHRFYDLRGMERASVHFRKVIAPHA